MTDPPAPLKNREAEKGGNGPQTGYAGVPIVYDDSLPPGGPPYLVSSGEIVAVTGDAGDPAYGVFPIPRDVLAPDGSKVGKVTGYEVRGMAFPALDGLATPPHVFPLTPDEGDPSYEDTGSPAGDRALAELREVVDRAGPSRPGIGMTRGQATREAAAITAPARIERAGRLWERLFPEVAGALEQHRTEEDALRHDYLRRSAPERAKIVPRHHPLSGMLLSLGLTPEQAQLRLDVVTLRREIAERSGVSQRHLVTGDGSASAIDPQRARRIRDEEDVQRAMREARAGLRPSDGPSQEGPAWGGGLS